MNWLIWIIIAAIGIFILLKRLTLVQPEAVRDLLKRGAKVIDVRSEAEFAEGHIPGAINIPLNRLGNEIHRFAADKQQPILLHCLSGGRSGIARTVLKKLGYSQCFNLGSFSRAQKLIQTSAGSSQR